MPLRNRPPIPRAHSEVKETPLTEITPIDGVDGLLVGTACYTLDVAGEYDELNRFYYSVTVDLTAFKIGHLILGRAEIELIIGKAGVDALCALEETVEEAHRNAV